MMSDNEEMEAEMPETMLIAVDRALPTDSPMATVIQFTGEVLDDDGEGTGHHVAFGVDHRVATSLLMELAAMREMDEVLVAQVEPWQVLGKVEGGDDGD